MKRIAVDHQPPDPLAAAVLFHQHWLPHITGALDTRADVMVMLDPADHTHREWRLAIAAGLARAHAPRRINLVAGEGAALDGFEAYLANAPGITGQYFESDGTGAGDPLVEAP